MTDRGETTNFVNDGRSLLASYTGFGLWLNVNVLAADAVVFWMPELTTFGWEGGIKPG